MTLRFTPLAAESMGVRSMAVFVETPDVKMLLDAGVSLGPRFGKPPHPLEYQALREARSRIREYAAKADVCVITHYHFDHYTATWRELEAKWTWSSYAEAQAIYGGKAVLAKDYRNAINPSQRRRGYLFSRIGGEFIKEIVYADSYTASFGGTRVSFSPPLPHGEEGTDLGYVLSLQLHHGEDRLMFCPDVQGPVSASTLRYILRAAPKVLIIGGPPVYLSGYKVDSGAIDRGLASLKEVASRIPLTIVDHHILRSPDGLREVQGLEALASQKENRVATAAEQLGQENRLLEATRLRLYEEHPPHLDFQKWMRLPPLRQRREPPPV